jgi:prepilin-type N-terminal cleavage/methylation domain-containing protein
MTKKNNKAFTLIEVMVVLVVIAILTTLTTVAYKNIMMKSRDSKRVADIKQIQAALETYAVDQGSYPQLITPGQALTNPVGTKTYLVIPSNPTPFAEGSCANYNQNYVYDRISNSSYELRYCLAKGTSEIAGGPVLATQKSVAEFTGKSAILPGSNLVDLVASGVFTISGTNQGGWPIAVSSDGNTMYAISGAANSILRKSTNGGLSWTNLKNDYTVYSIATSFDGSRVIMMFFDYNLYDYLLYTSVDGGATWVSQKNYFCSTNRCLPRMKVAISPDGTKVGVGLQSGAVYLGTLNSGTTPISFTKVSSITDADGNGWQSISLSNDNKIAVSKVINEGIIYISTDGGANWTQRTNISGISSRSFSVVYSADGSRLLAGCSNYCTGSSATGIFYSTDDGANWTNSTNGMFNISSAYNWVNITPSTNGMRIIAIQGGVSNGKLYLSLSGGYSWKQISSLDSLNLSDVGYSSAVSNDATTIMVAGSSDGVTGHMYVTQY